MAGQKPLMRVEGVGLVALLLAAHTGTQDIFVRSKTPSWDRFHNLNIAKVF